MKTIMTALVALTFTLSASANHVHNAKCPLNCPEAFLAVAPVTKSYDQKMAELKLASEDKVSLINYSQTMQRALNMLQTQQHLNAIENLEAENAYNNLMVQTLFQIEQQKLADQLEDVAALARYENLMGSIIADTAAR